MYSDLDLQTLIKEQTPSGSLPLFQKSFFPWKGLPYPKEHAELGVRLARSGSFKEVVSRMALFQQAALDHNGNPIFSLFRQEEGPSYEDIREANTAFFEEVPTPLKKEFLFVDNELGLLSTRTQDKTILLTGSGCKSGMGSVLYKDLGIVNFGPQVSSLGDCQGFGIAGRAKDFLHSQRDENSFLVSYRCRLAYPHPKERKMHGLADSGYSGLWMQVEANFSEDRLSMKCDLEGFRAPSSVIFSFFCRAESCLVSKTHKIRPNSLDRYMGPAAPFEIKTKEESLFLEPLGGFSKMDIIPLAGDTSYWSADFLIAYFIQDPEVNFCIFF